ncbi:GntR family transcriptional regulator [Frondihabitans peucedani]|uniref:HTH gntR-type domain-containing protein n=1 Tax=Frondihabitans peucedani TaxID=598626 RepID=A0ABP8E0Z8_9MICO
MPVPRSSGGGEYSASAQPTRRLLTDDVFDRLTDEIVRGSLAPGERIHDQDLAARFGLSRATIRTALLRLADLGLVETVPNLFTRVTPIRICRYLDAQDTARALSVFAVRYGTPVLTDAQVEALQVWATRLGDRDAVSREAIFDGAASGFFLVFQSALSNRPLDRALLRLRPHLQRVIGQYSHLLPARETDAVLLEVVAAAARRDADAAASAMTAYYDGPVEVFHARLREQPELSAD